MLPSQKPSCSAAVALSRQICCLSCEVLLPHVLFNDSVCASTVGNNRCAECKVLHTCCVRAVRAELTLALQLGNAAWLWLPDCPERESLNGFDDVCAAGPECWP